MATPMPSYASASLYVGDLSNDITEGVLFEIFNSVGPVVSIRVCRDAVTRRSLGYAYVNFHNVGDAERALDTMNNSPIKGKPCRIMWSQRDPSIRKSGVGNIFIKNLDKSIDHKVLFDTFSLFGNILSCKIAMDENNNSLGYGFVHYDNQESAQKAVAKVNGKLISGAKVYVGPFISRKERSSNYGGEKKFTNVYVKNLPEGTDEKALHDLFSSYGTITNTAISKHDSDLSKLFGFVNFENPDDARAAVDDMHGKEIGGRKLYVARAQKKAEREAELRHKVEQWKMERMTKYQGVNLYVKNLDDTVDDDRLRASFAGFGGITSAKVMTDDKGHSKGFGFVCFNTPEEATRAVTEMNGHMLGNKPLYVALAQRKEVRRAQLEAQHAQRQKGVRGGPGMPSAPMTYPPGAAMFYTGVSAPSPQPGFVYPQTIIQPRGSGWRGAPYQPMPYAVQMGNRQGQQQGQSNNRRNAGPSGQAKGDQRGGAANRRNNPRGGRDQNNAQAVQQAVTASSQNANNAAEGSAPAAAAAAPTEQVLTPAALASYPPEQQKTMLGDKLYHLVKKQQPELCGKITGMLLESQYLNDLFDLIEDNVALTAKVNEAVAVLEAHAASSQQAAAAEEAAQ